MPPCLHVHTVIIIESVFGWKQGDINGGFMAGCVTRFGFKTSPTKDGGRRRKVRRKKSGMGVINELRCSATSSFFVSPCTCPRCQTGFVLPIVLYNVSHPRNLTHHDANENPYTPYLFAHFLTTFFCFCTGYICTDSGV